MDYVDSNVGPLNANTLTCRYHKIVVSKEMNFVLELGSVDVFAAVGKGSPELCQLVGHLSNTWNFDWSRPVWVIVRETPGQLFDGHLVQAVILFHNH